MIPTTSKPRVSATIELLQQSIRLESISGNERAFVEFIAAWARDNDLESDLWESDEPDPQQFPKHLPLKNRPTLVIRVPGNPRRQSIIFNAHSDVVAAPNAEAWSHAPFSGDIDGDRIVGRGACDTKGPLVAALAALLKIRESIPQSDRGEILFELIPGEEDCVGLGTFTSVARGYRADAAVVLEPTENIPSCASRGGTRFEIVCTGKSVHGTVKWLGDDAIMTLRQVLDTLQSIEQKFNDRSDPLFAHCPLARPITVDRVEGGRWQGMICDRAICAGYLELLPRDSVEAFQKNFVDELKKVIPKVAVTFTETYHGHRLDPEHALCRVATEVSSAQVRAFNSGCEAGLRWHMHGTPTLVWGPGNLAHAHAVDESIGIAEVARSVDLFTAFTKRWCEMDKG